MLVLKLYKSWGWQGPEIEPQISTGRQAVMQTPSTANMESRLWCSSLLTPEWDWRISLEGRELECQLCTGILNKLNSIYIFYLKLCINDLQWWYRTLDLPIIDCENDRALSLCLLLLTNCWLIAEEPVMIWLVKFYVKAINFYFLEKCYGIDTNIYVK